MRTYTRDILEDRKRSLKHSRAGSDWVALAKFLAVMVLASALSGVVLHQRNKVKEQCVVLETELWEMERRNQELENKMGLRFTELERLRSTDIAERARAIGLRPARSHQVVRNIPRQKGNFPVEGRGPSEIVRK